MNTNLFTHAVLCLRYLEQTRSYFDVANYLGLSRWETLALFGRINQLENGLIELSSVIQVKLTRKIDWLNSEHILQLLSSLTDKKFTLILLDQVNSTHTYMQANLFRLPNRTIVTTEFQYQGRGRSADKIWLSRIGYDITLSILYFFPLEFRFESLSLIIAVAVNRLFKQLRIKTQIKWPNDIYVVDELQKVAGILVESSIRNDQRAIILGIGLNNILDIAQNSLSRSDLLAYLIHHIEQILLEYDTFGFALLRREWLDNCIHYRKLITLTTKGKIVDSGIHVDLSEIGELIIKSDKSMQTVNYNTAQFNLTWEA